MPSVAPQRGHLSSCTRKTPAQRGQVQSRGGDPVPRRTARRSLQRSRRGLEIALDRRAPLIDPVELRGEGRRRVARALGGLEFVRHAGAAFGKTSELTMRLGDAPLATLALAALRLGGRAS